MKTLIVTSLISLITLKAAAQQVENYGDFTAKQWTFSGKYTKADYMGKPAIKLIREKETATGATIAYLNDYTFSDGTIELDIATPLPKSMISFLGVLFHFNKVGNEPRYECFYFRPFMSGQSGAMQYMPINNGLVNWPDYQAAVYQGAPVCKTQQWFHVKVDVKGPMATVFVDGKQVYQIKNLARGSSKGSVGLWLGNTPEGYFANFNVTRAATTAGKTMN
ncbi:DUF1080 domain-containing protein [Spirosoma sp. HMF3257]|uniref:3-keto-alpha-glucoside-1,2-lyase/3-keto-2-hydroxy-glucal hydratase domain-containing protein n=1 Tax=Spirosoma telluris TaxID=2183553 RepID=A0A327NEQ2_9BACT|nr:DUF1080 domain-containing protein [Spirosoma telluris]RAI73607.1 hypothetical protein HMF3257_02710 [Spirosoma telluris]